MAILNFFLQNWPFWIFKNYFVQKHWQKFGMAKIGHSIFFQTMLVQKILEEIWNGQRSAFHFFLNHSNAKILEEIWNGQNGSFWIIFEPYQWKKMGRNLEQVKLGILNISESFWCKTIGRSSEKCKVYIGPMAASATAVAIAQWECCSASLNIVAIVIVIAIAQWEPALTQGKLCSCSRTLNVYRYCWIKGRKGWL